MSQEMCLLQFWKDHSFICVVFCIVSYGFKFDLELTLTLICFVLLNFKLTKSKQIGVSKETKQAAIERKKNLNNLSIA